MQQSRSRKSRGTAEQLSRSRLRLMRSADVRSQAMPPSRSEFEDSRGSNCVESSAAGEGDVLRAARNALERRSWQEAFGLYADADGVAPLEPAELLELAEAALWSSNADACVDARERAYAAFVQQAQPIAAARVALDLAADYFRKNSLASAAGALSWTATGVVPTGSAHARLVLSGRRRGGLGWRWGS